MARRPVCAEPISLQRYPDIRYHPVSCEDGNVLTLIPQVTEGLRSGALANAPLRQILVHQI